MAQHTLDHDDGDFPPTEAASLDALFGLAAPVARAEPQAQAIIRASAAAAAAVPEAPICTFLYARLHHFNAACQTMAGTELTEFVNEVRRTLSSAAQKLGGEIAQRRPDSILFAFTHNAEDRIPTHAKRALHAAILIVHDAALLADRYAAQIEAAGLPPLSMAVGVHLGPGDVTPRANTAERMVHAAGEAVEVARLLEGVAADLHWGVVASSGTRLAAGTRVDSGRSASIGLPDESFLELVEISGLVPRPGSKTPPGHYEQLRESLLRNQHFSRAGSNRTGGGGNLLIEDYRVLRKIGEGGNATVFLAQPSAGGPTQVLKVMRVDGPEGESGLQRFMQEYALLAGIDHPNVARFFRQGFSAGSAYIAMEYFPLGDLRQRIRRGLDPAIALYYLRQIAAGLEAIHQANIVHRDLKPDNIMLRADGIVAITDFGVAKQVSMLLTDTGAGEVVGTPYYLSPEQAMGQRVDARADLYSLGVMAWEMFTGSKPFHATTAQDLLRMHVEAPLPPLPAQHRRFEAVLHKLLAKTPETRYASATELLDELDRLQ